VLRKSELLVSDTERWLLFSMSRVVDALQLWKLKRSDTAA
jgi:hypothetical protein